MLKIRPSLPQDAPGVAALIVPIQQQEFGIAVTLAEQPDLADIAGFYQQGAGNFWIAEAEDHIVGTVGLLDIGNREAALRKMFVAEAFRGGQHGVAGALLDRLVAWSAASGIDRIYLGTTNKFLAAHRFYEKHGFVEIHRTDLPSAFPVMKVDSKFYRRLLEN